MAFSAPLLDTLRKLAHLVTVKQAARKRSLFEFSLRLSRACLGRMSIFSIQSGRKEPAVFSPDVLPQKLRVQRQLQPAPDAPSDDAVERAARKAQRLRCRLPVDHRPEHAQQLLSLLLARAAVGGGGAEAEDSDCQVRRQPPDVSRLCGVKFV
jgi:hypothetical protein